MLIQSNENLDLTILEYCLSAHPKLLKIKSDIQYNYLAIEEYIAHGGYETEHAIVVQLKKFDSMKRILIENYLHFQVERLQRSVS